MTRRSAKVVGVWLSVVLAPIAWSTVPGLQLRVAGFGPDASYYLVKDPEAGIVVNRLQTLEFLRRHAAEEAPVGYQLKRLLKSGGIVAVPYNTLVTTLELMPGEAAQTVHYQLFSDDKIRYGRDYTGSVIKVRADDGPAQGREMFAIWLSPRDSVVTSDRAWLRAQGMSAIPAAIDADKMHDYLQAIGARDEGAARSVARRARMKYLPTDTECTVAAIDSERRLAQVRVMVDGVSSRLWVSHRMLTPVRPAAPVPTP